MRRREFLEAGALAALAGAATGCANQTRVVAAAPPTPQPAARLSANLAVPRISWERVIRTTVGLRPHRDSGFVLKPEKFDDENRDPRLWLRRRRDVPGLGLRSDGRRHGAATQRAPRRGAGLRFAGPDRCAPAATARLRRHHLRDDRAARHHSNMSMAGFTPTTALIAHEKRTPAWDAQFRQAAEISYRQLQLLAGAPGYGVYWIDNYNATDDPIRRARTGRDRRRRARRRPASRAPAHRPRSRRAGPRRTSFPDQVRRSHFRLAIEPSIYLDNAGARFRALRRQDRDPQIRHAARPDVAARIDHRQLHRPGIEDSLQRRRTGADQGPAHRVCPAAGSELPGLRPLAGQHRHRQHQSAQRRHHRRQHDGTRQLVARTQRGSTSSRTWTPPSSSSPPCILQLGARS